MSSKINNPFMVLTTDLWKVTGYYLFIITVKDKEGTII